MLPLQFVQMHMFHRMMGRGEPDEAKIAELKAQLNAKLDVYEKILSKQPYLAGQVNGNPLFSSITFLSHTNKGIHSGRLVSSALWYMAH